MTDLRLNTNLKEIKADENGRVKSIIIEETGEEISCDVVGLTAGVTPNIDFLKGSGIELGRGVKVNRFLKQISKTYLPLAIAQNNIKPLGNAEILNRFGIQEE